MFMILCWLLVLTMLLLKFILLCWLQMSIVLLLVIGVLHVVDCWCSLCCGFYSTCLLTNKWGTSFMFIMFWKVFTILLLKFVMLLLIENVHYVVVEKSLPFVTTSRLIIRSLTMWPLHSHGIYHKYSKHFVSYYHSLH
jgi:hypothetical protein